MDVLHQNNVFVLAEGNLVFLIVHDNGHVGWVDVPDGHLVVLQISLECGRCIGYLELSVDCGDVGVSAAESVLEVNSDLDDVSGVSERRFVVVGLVLHHGVGDGRLDNLVVYDLSVLGQLYVSLVAVNIYGLNCQLIAVLQHKRVGGCDCLLLVVINQNLADLLVCH